MDKLEKFFKVKESGSTVRTEIVAGITTFFAMAYIVLVAPNQLTGFSTEYQAVWNSVYIASILVAVVGTLLMAFHAKMPYAQEYIESYFSPVFYLTEYQINKFSSTYLAICSELSQIV